MERQWEHRCFELFARSLQRFAKLRRGTIQFQVVFSHALWNFVAQRLEKFI